MAVKPKSWGRMSKRDRRVSLAKDVIRRIQTGNINFQQGVYLNLPLAATKRHQVNDLQNDDLASVEKVNQLAPDCQVCALGGLFLTRVAKFNQITWNDFGITDDVCGINGSSYRGISTDRDQCISGLNAAFSDLQLDLIECAFEKESCFLGHDCRPRRRISDKDYDLASQAVKFGRQHRSPANRMLAICQNIVDHGEFDPTVEYEILTK